jgi:putative FmdB family regulatory protein
MPVYEYRCAKCNETIEIKQKITDDPLKVHESCGGELRKIITNTSFVLKGSGWYVTDYPSRDRKNAINAEKPADKKKDTAAEKKSDKKSGKTTPVSAK